MFGTIKEATTIFRRKKGRYEVIETCQAVTDQLESVETLVAAANVPADSVESLPAKPEESAKEQVDPLMDAQKVAVVERKPRQPSPAVQEQAVSTASSRRRG